MRLLPVILLSCGVHKAQTAALESGGDAQAWEDLGDAYRRALKHDQAVEAYRTAFQLDPSRTWLQERMMRGPLPKDARELQRQAEKAATDDELWGDLGDLLESYGDRLGAQRAFLRAFQIDPTDGEWQQALARLGQADLVLRVAEPAVNDQDDESLGDYGDLLAAVGRTDEACEAWRKAAELDPMDDEWIGHAESCGFEVPDRPVSDTGGAASRDTGGGGGESTVPDREDLESLIQRVSHDTDLLTRLGQAYWRSGNRAKAEETLWGALLVAPTDEEALQSYLIVTGKTEREVLERLATTFPDNDEVVGLLADHYLALGLRAEARARYDKAHALDPDDPEWTSKQTLLAGP
jgi:tetratricopeptide (TPR) repeat protein